MNDFKYKKAYGQNFIKDDNIIKKIVNVSEVDKDTIVIEIGPGAGSLSKQIVPLSGYSILYEIDTRLEEALNNVLKDNKKYKKERYAKFNTSYFIDYLFNNYVWSNIHTYNSI